MLKQKSILKICINRLYSGGTMEEKHFITFREMVRHAQRMFGFKSYLYAGSIARRSLQKHRVSRRACVCYVNWANGEFTEQEIADRFGIQQQTIGDMIATVRKVWRHLPGKPPCQPMVWKVKRFDPEEHTDIVLKV